MSLKHIKELLKSNDSVFSFEEIWKSPIPVNKKYRTYLAPDSYAYHSMINPIFSFELEGNDFEDFRKFSLLSLRDGVYPLTRFFRLYPVPLKNDPYLIIDSKLEELIPLAWKSKCVLRELFVNKTEFNSNELLLLVSPDKDSLPLDLLASSCEKLKEQLKTFNEVSVYFSSCNSYGEEDPEYDSSWALKCLKVILEALADTNVKIIDFAQYNSKKMNNQKFYFLNPLSFYFSDSYLLHDLLQRGALPLLGQKLRDENDLNVSISQNHGFSLRPCLTDVEIVPDEIVMEKIFKGSIYRAPATHNLEKLKLSTKEFLDWASATARHLYDKNNL